MTNGLSDKQLKSMVTHIDHEMSRVLNLGRELEKASQTNSYIAPEVVEAYAAHFRTLLEFFGVGRGKSGRQDVRASDYLTDPFSILQNDAYASKRLADADKLLAHLSVGRIERQQFETRWGCKEDSALMYNAISAFVDATHGRWAFNDTTVALRVGTVMDSHLTRIFCREVELQARFGIIAATDLAEAVNNHNMDRIWYSLQGLLVAVANISKLLWSSSEEIAGRSSHLRESLKVQNDSPIRSRSFRNHFEHFDNRLEGWSKSSAGRNIVDTNVGPIGMISGIDPGDYLRNFDPSTYTVTFRGTTYQLAPVIDEIKAIQNLAAKMAAEI